VALGAGPLLRAGAAPEKPSDGWIALRSGLPKAEGLGRLAILSNWPTGDGAKAVQRLAEGRDAKVLRFRESDVRSVATALARLGPEFVAVAVTPDTLDVNFHLDVLDLSRGLDRDPMPDFQVGYLVARDGADLGALVDRTLARGAEVGREAAVVAATPPGDHLKSLDFLLHFGHGTPWGVQGGLTSEQVAGLGLARGPVVFSGACFNAVTSRSYHPSAYQLVHLAPAEVAPEKAVSLAWVHAGATGFLAALEGDRGEMAIAEWDGFRETAGPLGDVIGRTYRLAFTSVPDDFDGFPRYVPGARKRMGFTDVMLRGAVSRLLIGDPSLRPLGKPLDEPSSAVETSLDAGARTWTVTATVKRWSQGAFLNYLPKPPSDRFDRRVYQRVEVPASIAARPGVPAVRAAKDGKEIALTRTHLKHEVWGGARWVSLQVESSDTALGAPGSSVTWTFPLAK
jgi:hypothetical protein